jgi:hypothetical protein
LVRIKRTANNGMSYGMTDSSGVVKGKVPSNEPLVLEVVANYNCGSVIHTQNIGPYAAAASIVITVNTVSAQSSIITGTAVNCSGAPVTNGFVDVIVNFQTHRAPVVNGAFTINMYMCSASQPATLVVTDVATAQQSVPVSIVLTNGAVAAGAITACGTSVNQFINFTVNGTPYTLVPPGDSLMSYSTQQSGLIHIAGYSMNSGSTTSSNRVSFNLQGNAVGSLPVSELIIMAPGVFGRQTSNPITAIVTEFGTVGGFVAGTFAGNVSDSIGAGQIAVTVNFRVKR